VHLINAGCAKWLTMRRIQFSDVDITAEFPEVSRYLRFCPKIQRVWCFSGGVVDQIAINCRNLNSLVCTSFTMGPNFNSALAYNANLQDLRMLNVKMLITSLFEDVHLPQLATLSFHRTICNDALVGAVVRTTSVLQQIDVGLCQNFTDAGLIALAQQCPLLRAVGLRGLQLSNGALTELAQLCPHIEHINLQGNYMLTDAGVFSLTKSAKRLASICISYCTALTDKSLKHLTTYSGTTLHTLHMLDMTQVHVNVLVRLLKKCTRLHTLVLNCDLSVHFADVIPHMHRLQTLAVYAMIYDKELCAIARYCKQLEKLSILCTDKVDSVAPPNATNATNATNAVMHCALVEATLNDARYSEVGLYELMQGLPGLRLLVAKEFFTQNDHSWCEVTTVNLVRYLWQRLRPSIQFGTDDSAFRFSVFSDDIM